jgi:hypothetical protein
MVSIVGSKFAKLSTWQIALQWLWREIPTRWIVSGCFAGSFRSQRSFEGSEIPAKESTFGSFVGSFRSQRSFEGSEIPAKRSAFGSFVGIFGLGGLSGPLLWQFFEINETSKKSHVLGPRKGPRCQNIDFPVFHGNM